MSHSMGFPYIGYLNIRIEAILEVEEKKADNEIHF